MLKTRVFPSNSPELPKDTLYVFPKKDAVSEYNLKMFQELEGSFEVFTAVNILPTKKKSTQELKKMEK